MGAKKMIEKGKYGQFATDNKNIEANGASGSEPLL